MAEPDYANISFVNTAEKTYFHQARLGIVALDFMHSDLGRYLHGCAKQQFDDAQAGIMKLNPFDPSDQVEMARLQVEAAKGEQFMTWLTELITNGREAENQLKDEFEQ